MYQKFLKLNGTFSVSAVPMGRKSQMAEIRSEEENIDKNMLHDIN